MKVTKREAIDSFRDKLKERNADTTYSNQFLYSVLLEHARWLIKRETTAGRIYVNNSLFQSLVITIIEVPLINSCLNIKTNCKIYRSSDKLPEVWQDKDGAIIKSISSIDNYTNFFYTNSTTWRSKSTDPYQKLSKEKYAFIENDYLWIPVNNPHKIILNAYFADDLDLINRNCEECDNKKCVKFLDTSFNVPDWLLAEIYAKALESIAGITKKLPEDQQIDKNTTRKN